MSWLYLFIAGLFELGWPIGFKIAAKASGLVWGTWIAAALVSMELSALFLYLAQKTIPIGTAYLVWTGIGGVGTALIGIFFFDEPATIARLLCLTLVMAGIAGLWLFK